MQLGQYNELADFNHAFTFKNDSQFSVLEQNASLINAVTTKREFKKGEYLFHINDPATELFIVSKGQIKLLKTLANGNESIFAIIGKDSFVGAAFLSPLAYYRIDAIALEDTMVRSLTKQHFLKLIRNNPELMIAYTESLTGQLFSAWEQLSSSYSPVKIRLAQVLIELAQKFGKPSNEWALIDTNLNHNAIAALVSSTRVSVTTAMAELRKLGFVEGSRGKYKIKILDLQILVDDLI